MHGTGTSLNRVAFSATAHCLTGCAIGEVLGMVIGTARFYYRAYLKERPDLNWRNREVREAMLDMLRFWLERGADGFGVGALRHLMTDDLLRDNPPNPACRPGGSPYDALLQVYSADRPTRSTRRHRRDAPRARLRPRG